MPARHGYEDGRTEADDALADRTAALAELTTVQEFTQRTAPAVADGAVVPGDGEPGTVVAVRFSGDSQAS